MCCKKSDQERPVKRREVMIRRKRKKRMGKGKTGHQQTKTARIKWGTPGTRDACGAASIATQTSSLNMRDLEIMYVLFTRS